jgi:hypothetical protein
VIPLLCRAAPDLGAGLEPGLGQDTVAGAPTPAASSADAHGRRYDSDLGALLVWGMVAR